MLHYPQIDPVAFHLGPLAVHWYGLAYLCGFVSAWFLGVYRIQQQKRAWTTEQMGDLFFYLALGVIIGGRVGYMLFYDFPALRADPLSLFKLWQGGMAFHGGMLGVGAGIVLFARRYHRSFWEVTDFIVPLIPVGLALGRLANFINGELWGRITSVPWAMVFPTGGPWPRHPSQLYEFFLEGVLLFVILWCFSSKPRPRGAVSALFFVLYGSFRFVVEFFRQPDAQIGFVAFHWLTEGQLLSIPMILLGLGVMWYAYGTAKTRRERV